MANTILHDDILFATVSQHGNTILSLRLSGLTSVKDILKRLREAITGYMGMVTLKLRNGTQGWSMQQPLRLDGGRNTHADAAIQLTLF